jgi:hypothetical protein
MTRLPTFSRRALNAGLLAWAVAAAPHLAYADGLAPPTGEVILTLSGRMTQTNADGAAAFDFAMLDALPQRETVTSTPWHDGRHSFSGPTLSALMDAVGATGGSLHLVALNDYATDMPMEDVRTIPVILATRIDGEEISVRDKGPLFVIYPFDEQPELFNEVYFNRSVWQVAAIEIAE